MRTIVITAVLTLAAALTNHSAWAQTAEETAMARQIAASLQESGQLKNYQVGVKYQDGVAWLLGSVSSKRQEMIAVDLAERIDGVSHVVSKLEVEAPQHRPADLERSLRLASLQATQEQPSLRPTRTGGRQAMPGNAHPGMRRPLSAAGQRNMPVPAGRMANIHRGRGPGPIQQASAAGSAMGPGGYGYGGGAAMGGAPAAAPAGHVPGGSVRAASYDQAHMPGYAWPSYASYPNYAAVTYPRQYSPTAWPYIGPFYPYPQVPLGWRKVCLEWDDGWWFLDFSDCNTN